jgi:serine/threonine-protein kinase
VLQDSRAEAIIAEAVGEDGAPLAPGTSLRRGVYLIDEVLGHGGFGITYRARDMLRQEAVAIKEFFPEGCRRSGVMVEPPAYMDVAGYSNARAKFFQESNVLAHFEHPGIVHVHDVFEENHTAYMVMEYLEGKTLLTVMYDRGGRLSEGEAIAYIERAGEALEQVHQAGVLHRDLKPDNIIVCRNGRVVLVDFGTAREMASSATWGHTVVVTPGYAPLEQYARHAERGVTTDIYALAATLYHLLTGCMPVSALERANGVALKPPRDLRPGLNRNVSEAIVWAMQLKVAQRPPTLRAFLDALWAKQPAPAPAPATVEPQTASLALAGLEAAIEKVGRRRLVTVPRGVIRWPQKCACCGGKASTTVTLHETTGTDPLLPSEIANFDSWKVPYCHDCVAHLVQPSPRATVTIMCMILGPLVTAFILTALFSPDDSLWFQWFLLAGMVCCVAVPALRQWDIARHRNPHCTHDYLAVRYKARIENKHGFEFYNHEYGEEFFRLNARAVITTPQEKRRDASAKRRLRNPAAS